MVVLSHLQLNTGALMPTIGFGTWQASGDDLEAAVNWALETGYRHIDTAAAYANEEVVGNVLHEWISSGRVTREELFIATKLPPAGMSPDGVDKFVVESLSKLKVDYLDMYLVHVPFGFQSGGELTPFDEDGKVALDMDTSHIAIWNALESHSKSGKLKAIGVSNFTEEQIERICVSCEIPPANLQIEMHVFLQQKNLVEYCKTKGIVVTAYSPLGTPGMADLLQSIGVSKEIPDLMGHPEVKKIAVGLHKSPAQILIRFLLEKGVNVIPKSTSEIRIKANFQVFDFELGEDNFKLLEGLDREKDGRIVDFAFFKGVERHPEFPFRTT